MTTDLERAIFKSTGEPVRSFAQSLGPSSVKDLFKNSRVNTELSRTVDSAMLPYMPKAYTIPRAGYFRYSMRAGDSL